METISNVMAARLWVLVVGWLAVTPALAEYDCAFEQKSEGNQLFWRDLASLSDVEKYRCTQRANQWLIDYGFRYEHAVLCKIEAYRGTYASLHRNNWREKDIYQEPKDLILKQNTMLTCLTEVYQRIENPNFKVLSDNDVKIASRSPNPGTQKYFHPKTIEMAVWTAKDGVSKGLYITVEKLDKEKEE